MTADRLVCPYCGSPHLVLDQCGDEQWTGPDTVRFCSKGRCGDCGHTFGLTEVFQAAERTFTGPDGQEL